MSYYSKNQYKPKNNLWFEIFYFNRWFKNNQGPILDIGCATGNFIAVNPKKISGIEFDNDCLEKCYSRGFDVKKLNIANELDRLDSNYYNGVYAKQIIEHLEDPLYFLKHINRVLKKGGNAVILTPNCPYALNRFFWDDYTHVRPLTKISLKKLALDAGFKEFYIYMDFRSFTGVGFLIRKFNLSPRLISKIQNIFFIRGLTLVMELKK